MQEQEQWQESRAQFAAAARMLRETPASHQRTAGLVQAIDGIAYNDRELGNFRAAQQSYEAGLQELPDAAAHFHYQLGRHHQLGGRPMTAVSHLQIAAALDPQGYGSQAAVLIRQLAAGSPGCLLGAPTVGSK
jgi:tetratricopeptide (TPR) repeat protein